MADTDRDKQEYAKASLQLEQIASCGVRVRHNFYIPLRFRGGNFMKLPASWYGSNLSPQNPKFGSFLWLVCWNHAKRMC